MNRAIRILLMPLVLAPAGCYAVYLDEFDSVAKWEDPLVEPRDVSWSVRPHVHHWYSWLFSDDVPALQDNPSAFARERIIELAHRVGGDLSRTAQVMRRLLWVIDKDPNPFNRIVALQGVELMMRRLKVDPLEPGYYYEEPARAEALRRKEAFENAHAQLTRLFSRSDKPALSAAQRESYVEALRVYSAHPRARLSWQRDQIRTTWSIFVDESDGVVREAARKPLFSAISTAACNGLRTALVPQAVDVEGRTDTFEALKTEDFPAVRLEALLVYRRLGGIPAVPLVLQLMDRPRIGIDEQRYDQDLQVRMLLVRLCSQLRYEHAVRGTGKGPRPIEFLYETAIDDEEDEGLRRLALEGLARCLGQRRISLELDWARAWWKQYIIDRNMRP